MSPVGPANPNGEDPQEDPAEEARRRQEEWERRNEELKEELGIYYVPLPPLDQPENPPVKVKGIFLTGHSIAFTERYERMLKLIEETELNAVVIDIKDDRGRMSYRSEIEAVNELDAYYKPVPLPDIRATLDELHERGIYTIGRIVVFRDSEILPVQRPEWCIPLKDGGLYRDAGFAYGNPFNEELQDYNIAIAKEAALLGFNEIQFDYIRFPDKAAYMDQVAYYPGRGDRSKSDAISGFIQKARQELAPYNVHVAYDVFGVIANSWGDSDDIGQVWEEFAAHSDYICPMIYPSHYYPVRQGGSVVPYWFGLRFPDTNPSATITGALSDAIKRNAAVENPAIIRPWLQAFTAKWLGNIYGAGSYITYGPSEIRAQIDAALALGIDEYILWDANNENYPRGAFYTAAESDRRTAALAAGRTAKGQDALGRTARQAAEAYLEAFKERRWREAYALQRIENMDGNRYQDWFNKAGGRLKEWKVSAAEQNGDTVQVTVDLTVSAGGEEAKLTGEQWPLVLENNVWRIRPSERFLKLIEGAALEELG
ncbi:MAG: putative glycoside hydrolase [Bacillota bacterium]